MSDKMQNESGQFNHIELRKRQKCGQSSFLQFSDILDVYFGRNEQFDMIPSKSCQVSSDTSLEYQQGVGWLQMTKNGLLRLKKGIKRPRNGLKCLKSRLPFMNMDIFNMTFYITIKEFFMARKDAFLVLVAIFDLF